MSEIETELKIFPGVGKVVKGAVRRIVPPSLKKRFSTLQLNVSTEFNNMFTTPASTREHLSTKSKPTTSANPKPKPALPLSPTVSTSFELTPLSSLIKQSYADLKLLRRIHTSPTIPPSSNFPSSSAATTNNNISSSSLPHSATNPNIPQRHEIQQILIDFDKIEANLKRFEELYEQFLRYGGKHGEEGEEVHLVAVVCKRSDVVKGRVVEGEGVPTVERIWVDCGL